MSVPICGIYQIQSKIKPEKIYIGSSVNILSRWRRHLCDLNLNRHSNSKLQNHYNKYGKMDFIFSIIAECNREDLLTLEQSLLDIKDPWFNIMKIVDRPLGVKRSKEFCEGISNRQRGKKRLPFSKEWREKISIGNKYKIVTQETRDKLSKLHKGREPWNKGLHNSEGMSGKIKRQNININIVQLCQE